MQCPECKSTHIRKNGHKKGKQNHICVNCGRQFRELHKKDDPIVKWFDKGFPQTTLANGEVD